VISVYCQIYCESRGGQRVAGDGKSIYFPNFLIWTVRPWVRIRPSPPLKNGPYRPHR